MSYFALRHKLTGQYAGFTTRTDAETYEVEVHLSLNSGYLWTVSSRDEAETAACSNPERYNATHETPGNEWVGEWVVVELDLPSK